jgi:ferritin-like protein
MNELNLNNKTKTALCKLISEEWIAYTMYEQMVLGCNVDERKIIEKLFITIASEEKDDHYYKLIRFASQLNIKIPCKMEDYKKFADE